MVERDVRCSFALLGGVWTRAGKAGISEAGSEEESFIVEIKREKRQGGGESKAEYRRIEMGCRSVKRWGWEV